MKTKLLFLAFIFSSCFLFSQTNNIKSSWVGGGFTSYYTGAVAGDEFYIAGSEFEQIQVGDKITKVKFYHYLGTMTMSSGPVTFDNSQYTIKIYNNPPLVGPYAGYGYYNPDIGTPVFTQTITLGAAENDQIYEMTLSTPYIVDENDFWVAVCFDNGKGAMRIGELDALSDGKYYMYWDGDAIMAGIGTVIGKANFGTPFNAEYHPIGISIFVDDDEPYTEQSDLTIKFLDTYPISNEYISEKTINGTENLIIYPVIFNNGVDATTDIATITATIGGEVLVENLEINLSGTNSINSGYFRTIYDGGAFLITASEMNTLELTGLFDIYFTVTYAGSDPVSANNTTCLTVTRGEIPQTTCDLEALFVTSNTDLTPISTNITIGLTDDITLFPAVKNNGSDDANNYAEIKIIASGINVDTYSKNLTGLLNGETISLTETGSTVTAEVMDMIGSSGSFDICLTVTYAGTDDNPDNNTLCVTITREDPVNVDTNIAAAISVFPNPANSIITVANAENENIVVLNMLGEVVANISNATSNQTIDISNLSNGTYFVRVNSEVFKINVIK